MRTYLFYILIITFSTVNAQYSGYYNVDVNQNINANINKTVNGQITVNKNISAIDYSQLALANAQKEKTRLENIKYTDENKDKFQ